MSLKIFKEAAPEKFTLFGGVDWSAWEDKGNTFAEWAADRLRQQAARGAEGLKIWKNFGLHVRDQHRNLVTVDDIRLDPIWQTAGELHLPVMIHVADPVAFFDPIDAKNANNQLRGRREFYKQALRRFLANARLLTRFDVGICEAISADLLFELITFQRLRTTMSDYMRWLIWQMFSGIHDLRFQFNLLPHMLTVVDLFNLPLFLSHSTPPVYAVIVEGIKNACQ